MSSLRVRIAKKFSLTIDDIASDKSISHRCAIFSLLSNRMSVIKNYLYAEDTINTLRIIQHLGARISRKDDVFFITPPFKITEPSNVLNCGNSGTSMRLLAGLLAGVDGFFVLHGDKYLATRPMRRIIEPLRQIGVNADGRNHGEFAPISIRGGNVKSFNYSSQISSAQVKSALILAALNSDDVCTYFEPELSRNHTEKILKTMGVRILYAKDKILIYPKERALEPINFTIPADPSSAFFFAVAAAITPNSKVTIKNALLNSTRIEAYNVLAKMGAKVEFVERSDNYEKVGDIVVEHSSLKAVEVSEKIAWLIDELPALSIAFACAEGVSKVRNAQELRVKESDRISTIANNLRACGIEVYEFADGYDVKGGVLQKAKVNSFGDHRVAMSFAIAGLVCDTTIDDVDCIKTSFPNFVEILKRFTEVS